MSEYDYGIYGFGETQTRRVFKDLPWLWAITLCEPCISPHYVEVHNASITKGNFLTHFRTWWANQDYGRPNLRQLWVYIEERISGRVVGKRVVKLKYEKWGGEKYKNPIKAVLGVYKGHQEKTLYLAFGHWHRENEMCQSVVVYRPPKGIKSFEEFFKDPEVVDAIMYGL
jgi:hypothetical protein